MRIALLATEAVLEGSGFGRHVRDLSLALRLIGHDPLLVGMVPGLSPGLHTRRVEGTRLRLLKDVPGKALEGVEDLLDEEQPDVLWLLQLPGARRFLDAAAERATPVVTDFHGLSCSYHRPPDAGARRSADDGRPVGAYREPDERRYVLSSSTAVIAHHPSEFVLLERDGCPPDVVHMAPLGVDYRIAALRAHPNGSAAPGLRLVFDGPLARPAGAHFLLEALELLPGLPVSLLLRGTRAGEPGFEERIAAMAAEDDRVEIRPAEEAGDPLAHADLLVVPSLVPGACPVLPLAAVGAGIPLVVSDESGLAGVAGTPGELVVPAGDAAALARVLERLTRHPESLAEVRGAIRRPPGVEEEALVMERIARATLEPGTPQVRLPLESRAGQTRLVGGGVDSPTHQSRVRRTAVVLGGWALTAPQPVACVEVSVNDGAPERARLGLPRPVLTETFAGPEAVSCGFELWVDLALLADEVTAVRFDVDVIALDGSRFPLWPVEVEVAPRPVASAEVLERAGVLAERSEAAAAGAPRPRAPAVEAPEIHLGVFGHDLRYGGAQLYLFELLRRLAEEPGLRCTVVSLEDGPLRGRYEAMGMPVHVTSYPGVERVDQYLGRLAELGAWVRERRFDAVLGNTLLSAPAIDVAGRLGIPSVWAIHESYDLSTFWEIHLPHVTIDPVVAERMTSAFASAGAVVFEADATRRMFERYGDPRRFVKVGYGIDLDGIRTWRAGFDRTAARARLGIPESAQVLLFLGTIEPRKSQALLAQAFRRVIPVHPDAFLVLVGDTGGVYAQGLKDYVDQAGIGQRTRIVPVMADTYEWYAIADVFVCPSDLESLPRSVLEAMAFGVPVASTNAFGLAELIEDGRTGYLCRDRDLRALTDLLVRVLGEPAEARGAVARAAARMVATHHDSSSYARTYLQLLRALVANPAALPGDVLG